MKLYNRETSYYTIITIPKCLVSKYGKKQIWRSLNTKDYKLAKLRAELETMSIRRKLLNDLNKQKEKTSKALDFAQILDDDDDDFFEDDIDIKDTVDFSHYTEEEFAKLDDFYAMANMSHQTYEKFKEIKKRYRQQQKIQKALEKEKADNQIRSSIYDYDEQQAEDLIPCIFPIKNKKTLLSLPDDEWNLYDIRTNELVNPLVVATDEKVMMSDYEFNNMAVSIVKDYIRKEKMKFESYCDIIGIYPQIWFKDENDEMSWIYVIYSTNGKFSNVSKELDKLITGMPQFNGYIAQVGLACAEKDGPYRGAGFYIKFNGIEKIYSAHRDTGHGYGIEIKIK